MKGPPLSGAQEAVRVAPTVRRMHVGAVAGAGKTRVLLDRVRYLVGQGVEARRIWFVAFSRAARGELERRLRREGLHCRPQTLHALCLAQLGGKRRVEVLEDRHPAWKAVVAELELVHTRFDRPLTRVLEQVWQVPPEQLDPARRRLREDAGRRLRALDAAAGRRHLTFAGLLAEVRARWGRDPRSLDALRAQFDHLIVDEVQDISPLQAELVERLAGDLPLLTVGDRDQSIFGFQGATPDVFDGFAARADRGHVLDVTYRSPAQHVLAAEALTGRVMVPAAGFRGSLAVYRMDRSADLIEGLVTVVGGMAETATTAPVAVLAATNEEVGAVTGWLREAHLVVRASSERDRVSDPYCRDVLWPVAQYLARRADPRGPHPLLALAPTDDADERDLLHAAWRTGRTVSEVRRVLANPRLGELLGVWEHLQDWRGSLTELPDMLRTVLPIPCSDVARHHCLRAEDAQDLCNRLGAQVPEGGVQVVVSTIHGAKGLEWPQVVLYDGGQAQGRDPRTPEEEQEAVRLRYVAVTRSTRDLVALLHRDCHPAYDRMFAPEVLGRIRRLEELFGEGPAGHLDETRVAADLAASAPVLRYLREFPAHLPPERRRRLDAVLGRDPGEDRPPSTPPRVRRIPLVGRPARPEAD